MLPLDNFSGDVSQDYLGEAMASEIWNRLATVDGVRLLARQSARSLRDSTLDARDIASRLTASHLIDGSFIRDGDHVRASVQLIDGEDGAQVWSQSYDRNLAEMSGVLALYDGIADQIAGAMRLHFTGSDDTQTRSLAAYDLVQRARFGGEDISERYQWVEQAIELDPGYADAHATRAMIHAMDAELLLADKAHFAIARQSAARALELEPGNALALAMLGVVHDRLDLDFSKALAAYDEAARHGATPEDLAWKQDLYLNAGAYEAGVRFCREWQKSNPVNGVANVYAGRLLLRLGRWKEAKAEFETAISKEPENWHIQTEIVTSYALQGLTDGARRMLADFDQVREWVPVMLSLIEGDLLPAQQYVKAASEGRGGYQSPLLMALFTFHLGRFDDYIRWEKIRIEQRANVSWIMDFINFQNPDYWQKLEAWVATATGDERTRRADLLADHRTLIAATTERMVLTADEL